ncbi:MAG: gamma carbonic anhydrase family protein [Rickettsiaceae bacterium H1]|nr:gamma carbonic anhydrase family protein [Rickettsiaceae bacterium H1]
MNIKIKKTNIDKLAFVAPSADIIGEVTVGKNSSVWYGCVLRGDVSYISIGKNTNVQDGTIIHVDRHGIPTTVGNGVTIGHKCLLHACTIQSNTFIGMGAIIMDKAVIEEGSMVAAGSLVTSGKRVRKGEIWAGSPAKLFRNMTQLEIDYIKVSADNYVTLAREYLNG